MELTQEKVSIIRKYPLETLVVLLCVAIGFISAGTISNYSKIDELNVEFKAHLEKDNERMLDVIQKNTAVMEQAQFFITQKQQ